MRAHGLLRVVPGTRVRSGQPCTIETSALDDRFLLKAIDKSGVSPIFASLNEEAARELHEALSIFLDPISGCESPC